MKLALLLALAFALTGCVRYNHTHLNLDGTTDTTRFSAFLYVGSASKIRSEIRAAGTNYIRIISVGAVQGKGDADVMEAVAKGAAQGAMQGAKGGM